MVKQQKRFLDKIDLMDASFCTTDPKSLKLNNKYNVYYLPNPVDESFETLKTIIMIFLTMMFFLL